MSGYGKIGRDVGVVGRWFRLAAGIVILFFVLMDFLGGTHTHSARTLTLIGLFFVVFVVAYHGIYLLLRDWIKDKSPWITTVIFVVPAMYFSTINAFMVPAEWSFGYLIGMPFVNHPITIAMVLYIGISLPIQFFTRYGGCEVIAIQNLILASGPTSIPNAVFDSLRARVVDFMSEEAERTHIPGLVFVVATQRGVVFAEGYGFADIERRVPMTTRTGLRLGSVSKPVTATAVMQLVERGEIRLGAPLSEYVSNLELEDRYGRASTVMELLTHRGGYDDTVVQSHAPTLSQWQPLVSYMRGTLPPRAMPPGKVMSYSSWGHALLGYAMEEVTGSPYERVIAQNLLVPLGMAGSTFEQPLPAVIEENLATGYGYVGGAYQVVPHDFVRLSPGVALVSNGADMGRFMQTMLAGGQLGDVRVLAPETVDLLLRRQVGDHPLLRGRSLGFSELTLSGRRVVYHDGNGIGFSNRMVLVPSRGIGLFISINHRSLARNATSTAASNAMKQFATHALELLVPKDPPAMTRREVVTTAAGNAARLVGQYRLASTARRDFFRIAGLTDYVNVVDNGDGTAQIGSSTWVGVEPLVYQHRDVPSAHVVFLENDRGDVTFLTYGGTGSYRRIGWFETASIQMGLTVVMLLLFFSMAVIWPRVRHGHWTIWAVCLLNLTFFVAFSITMLRADFLTFFKTVPTTLNLVMRLPWLSAVLTLVLPIIGWRTLQGTYVRWWWRAHYTAVTFAAFAFLWYANYWNIMTGL